ncbi:MAG TPA: DUF3341 domain-containing protein [Bryobacteraceae bacterium]|nr:DUF3341 domain-containing protein [Bryobacteraceae bacterium]
MASRNTAAYGIFADEATAKDAVEGLKSSGFRAADISIMLPDNLGTKDFAHEKHSKAPEGAATGGSAAGIAGGVLGYLIGAGSFMLPGLEPFAAAGPVMAALGGLGAGAVVGGVTGALVGLGIPEYEAKRYVGRIRRGGILMSVHCDDAHWAHSAMSILRRCGAMDTAVRPEGRGSHVRHHRPAPPARVPTPSK